MRTFEIQRCVCVKESVAEYRKEDFTVTCSDDVVEIAKGMQLDADAEERLWMMCISARGTIIALHEVSHGDLTSATSSPREIFKRAIINNAGSILLLHNHPSGDSHPSEADIVTTERIKNSGELLGIPLLDHIILGDGEYTSMKAEGSI